MRVLLLGCGAIGGVIAAIAFRRLDPMPPRKRYSWEDEEAEAETAATGQQDDPDGLELPRPREVPVLWQTAEQREGAVVVRFRPRPPAND